MGGLVPLLALHWLLLLLHETDFRKLTISPGALLSYLRTKGWRKTMQSSKSSGFSMLSFASSLAQFWRYFVSGNI